MLAYTQCIDSGPANANKRPTTPQAGYRIGRSENVSGAGCPSSSRSARLRGASTVATGVASSITNAEGLRRSLTFLCQWPAQPRFRPGSAPVGVAAVLAVGVVVRAVGSVVVGAVGRVGCRVGVFGTMGVRVLGTIGVVIGTIGPMT